MVDQVITKDKCRVLPEKEKELRPHESVSNFLVLTCQGVGQAHTSNVAEAVQKLLTRGGYKQKLGMSEINHFINVFLLEQRTYYDVFARTVRR